jgi:hypothetical protein
VIATIDGVVLLPSAFAMTTGSPPSMIATQEFVVPRSMPITLLIVSSSNMGGLTTRGLLIFSWPYRQLSHPFP